MPFYKQPLIRSPLRAHFAVLALCVSSSFSANAVDMQEVVVYSSPDQASLADTAASIAIFDQAWLTRNNSQHIEHLLGAVPNVNFSGGASRARFVQMRGVGDIEQFVDPKAHPSVGLVVDGIDFSGLFGAGLLFDTGQVEVQRGPQGTALGASALAGSINIVSSAPTNDFTAYVEAGAGHFNARQLGGAVSGAVSEHSNARLAARAYRSNGWIENSFLNADNTGELDEFIAKLQVDWQNDDKQSTRLTAIHIDNDNGYDAFSLDNSGTTTQSDQPGDDKQRITALAATFSEAVFSDSAIDYKLTWLKANTQYSYDEDWADPGLCNPPASCGFGFFSSFDAYRRQRNDYSAEFKLQNERYLLGFFAQDRNIDLHRSRIGDAPLSFSSRYETERLALFGQLSPLSSEHVQVKLGGRYEWFDDEYSDSDTTSSASDEELWQINASAKYRLSKNAQLYLLVSRGNKAGGVNTDATTNIGAIDPAFAPELQARLRYASESLSNYEMGVDFASRDHAISGKVSLFYNLRNNPQFETFLYDNISSFLFVGYQDNARKAESHGIELQFAQRFNRHLSVEYSASFIDSQFRGFRAYDFDLGGYRDVAAKQQPRAPSYQYYVASTWNINSTVAATLIAEGRDSYEFAYYFDEQSGHINLLHASIQYQHDNLSVTGWLRNLRDEDYPVHGLYFANDPRDSFSNNRLYTQSGEPRNGGVTLRYNF